MSLPGKRSSISSRFLHRAGLAAVAFGLFSCKVAGGPFVTIPVSALPTETTTLLVKATFGGQERMQQFKPADIGSAQVLTFELPNGSSGPMTVHVDATDGTCVLASGDTSVEVSADAAYEMPLQLTVQPLSGCSFLTYTLSVTATQRNSAMGSVTSDIPGIDCGTRCQADFRPNTAVTLQARVPIGARIVSWSEASCNTGQDLRTCKVVLTSKKDVTVTFDTCKGVWCDETAYGGSTNTLRSIWAGSPTLIYVAGDGPSLLRYDSTAWRNELLPQGAGNLRGVSSLRTMVFPVAAGEQGTALHSSVAGWSQTPMTNLPQTRQLNAGGGYDGNSLYVIGSGGFIAYWHPTNLLYVPVTKDPGSSGAFPPTVNLNALAPLNSATGRHLLVGDMGYCATGEPTDARGKYKLVEQTCGANGKNLYGAWFGTAFGYVVGDGGTILRYNGTLNSYMAQTSGTTVPLRAVWGSSDTQVVAVGDGGTILRYDGTNWTPQASGIQKNLNGVWGLTNGEIYAVGDSGTILHYFP